MSASKWSLEERKKIYKSRKLYTLLCKRELLLHFFSSSDSYFFSIVASNWSFVDPSSRRNELQLSTRPCAVQYAIIDLWLCDYISIRCANSTWAKYVLTAHCFAVVLANLAWWKLRLIKVSVGRTEECSRQTKGLRFLLRRIYKCEGKGKV